MWKQGGERGQRESGNSARLSEYPVGSSCWELVGRPTLPRTREGTALYGSRRPSGGKAGGIRVLALDSQELITSLSTGNAQCRKCSLQSQELRTAVAAGGETGVWVGMCVGICLCLPADAEGTLPGSLCPASPHPEPQRGARGKPAQAVGV